MWRVLLNAGLMSVAVLAMLCSLFCCYTTFATNDYRPILAAALVFWLIGTVSCGLACWLDREIRLSSRLLWTLSSALIWADLVIRIPSAFWGWRW